jgi:serine/threonine protein kinase
MDFRPNKQIENPHANHQRHEANIYAAYAGSIAQTTSGPAETMWWDQETIESTVTRAYVLSKLRPDEQARLTDKVGFGGLTDDTYLEWIQEKAQRIFLILVDLDVPDQIFGIIDDSWDDDDLPIPLDQIWRLKMTYNKSERTERQFYQRQFTYLVRKLVRGELLRYEDDEIIPLESVDRRPSDQVRGTADKVHLPGRPDDILLRRRIRLGVGEGKMLQEDFLSGIESMKVVNHEHLMSLWGAYIHHGYGYVLMDPVSDSTFKSFLSNTPQSIKILAKSDRRLLLLNWLHCLSSALACLHSKGLAHRKIKPSNVMLDIDMKIFLSDCGPFHPSPPPSKSTDKESYDYAPPESWESCTLSPHKSNFSSLSSRQSSIQSSRSASTDNRSSISTSSSASSSSSNPQVDLALFGLAANTSAHDPQKADIFSLGCIFLEILTFFLKRDSRNFASYRAPKKAFSRNTNVDSSFHNNLAQVESWMGVLAKDASKKEDQIFRGISHLLSVIGRMTALDPEDRPTADEISNRVYKIMTDVCKIEGKKCHCGIESGIFSAISGLSLGGTRKEVEADARSATTRSSEGKSKASGGSGSRGDPKLKPKAKAWKAPVYAGMSSLSRSILHCFILLTLIFSEFSFG